MSLMVVMVLLLTVALEVGEQLCWTMKSRLLRGGVIWIGAGILTHFARLAAARPAGLFFGFWRWPHLAQP